MKNTEPQQLPSKHLYLADVLAELAGPDLDVELDALLTDDALPLEMRREVAQKRDDLITEIRRRFLELRTEVDKRHRIHADRAGYAQARREAEDRRAEEQRQAEQCRATERLILKTARRRAEAVGFTLEPVRVLHETAARPFGHGSAAVAQFEELRWRITAPLDHPAVEHTRDSLTPTQDGKSVELIRNTLRGCCEWLTIRAADGDSNQGDAPAPEPHEKPRRRRETPRR